MRILLAAVAAAALIAPATASAQSYPPPKDPGPVQSKPKGPHKTLTVCKKKGRCDFTKIQKAVNKARAGDSIRVRNGVYREAVKIDGRKKRYLKLIGNPKHPRKVVLRARGNMQNGVFVNGASEVTVNGFMAPAYKSNGCFFTNPTGYTMNHLIARRTGVYGLYAFNTIGGRMTNSEAYYANDGAFYIGQTPPQAKPVRTIVRNVEGWGSPLGFSGTNMRYVTITKSRFYNNALGIVPNALDSEKYPPEEDNAIVDNDIFWNNFDFHKGAPFPQPNPTATGALAPIGTGVVLLGGRGGLVANHRFFGDFAGGVGLGGGILIQDPKNADALSLDNNQVTCKGSRQGGTNVNRH